MTYARICLALATTIIFGLFYLGAQPFAAGLFPPPWDKLAHFAVYFTLAGLFSIATEGEQSLQLIGVVSIIGVSDEWHQLFLPGRCADLDDLFTDMAAAICAVMILNCLRTRWAATAATPDARGC